MRRLTEQEIKERREMNHLHREKLESDERKIGKRIAVDEFYENEKRGG